MFEVIIKRLSLLIVVISVLVVIIQPIANDMGEKTEVLENKKTVEIFRNLVAYVDSKIMDDSYDIYPYFKYLENHGYYERTYTTFDYMKKSQGVKFMDAYVDSISKGLSTRAAQRIYMRYMDDKNHNYFICFTYSEVFLDDIDWVTERLKTRNIVLSEEYDDVILREIFDPRWYESLVVYSDYDDEFLGIEEEYEGAKNYDEFKENHFDKSYFWEINRMKNENDKISNCYYELTDRNEENLIITRESLDDVYIDNDYIKCAKDRYEKIREYEERVLKKSARNEKKIGTKIKRLVFKLYNEDHSKYAPNEEVYYAGFIDDSSSQEDDGVEQEKDRNIVVLLNPEREADIMFLFDLIQMIIVGVACGLLSKNVPKIFGYEKTSFGEGMLYGGILFFVAILQYDRPHLYLEYSFLLGIVPMIKGILLGVIGKKKKLSH